MNSTQTAGGEPGEQDALYLASGLPTSPLSTRLLRPPLRGRSVEQARGQQLCESIRRVRQAPI
jgi:hypothetical protein